MDAGTELAMDQAIAWHVALATAGADEWRVFVDWLEADPSHQDAYDRVTLADTELVAPVEFETSAPPCVRRVWPQRVVWGLSGLTAVAAAWMALLSGGAQRSLLDPIETAPGVHRNVRLSDGTLVSLNGGTRLLIDRRDPRRAVLERGEAMFEVVHHADRPFEVAVGGVTLRDVGTRFNVAARGSGMDVAVAEGAVIYQPDAEAVSLTRGMALARRLGDDEVRVTRIAAEAVGGWRKGVLDFRGVPLGIVAEDVARSTGAPIRVEGAMAARPFTGTLRVDRAPAEVVASLAALAGGRSRRDGPAWMIEPTSAGAP